MDTKGFTFSNLGRMEGVSSQRVFSISQTNDGAVWWATQAGIDRYNGSIVKNYEVKGDGLFGHKGGRVIRLVNDAASLYAFDNRGFIFRFNAIHDRFELVTSLREKFGHEISLNDVSVSRKGLVLALYNGIFVLQDTTLTSLHRGVWAEKIVMVRGERYYLTREGVLNGDFRLCLPLHALSGWYDQTGDRLWLGSYDSGVTIASFDATGKLSIEKQLSDPTIQNHPIRSICPWDEHTILIGVDGGGLYQAMRNSPYEVRPLFNANEGHQGVLHGNGIYDVLVDRWHNIVIGSYTGGIDIARPVGSTTAVFRHIQGNKQSLVNEQVNTVLELSPTQLLMGTDNGISILDTQSGHWTHLLQGVVVLKAYKAPDGRVLLSTYGNGVFTIDSGLRINQAYTCKGGLLKDDHVYATYYDANGNLWIGGLDGELAELTSEGEKYYSVDNVQTITQIAGGPIFVGTAFGLKRITPGNHKVEDVSFGLGDSKDYNPFVTHIYPDKNNRIWIGTDGGGVYIYDTKKKKTICQLTTADGLPSEYVRSIAADKMGRIWIATEKGLCFALQSSPKHIVNVNYCYGLDRIYSNGAVAMLTNGDMLYGTSTGALITHPNSIRRLDYTAQLSIRGVKPDEDDNEDFQEQTAHMLKNGKLELDYNQRSFSIVFESINMRNHYDICYRYRLSDGDWSEPTSDQTIRFDNLEPGHHQLCLQAVSRTSGIVIDEKTLTIIIRQPWWNTWWMWMIYIVLLLAIFYGAWKVYQLQTKYMRLSIDYLKLRNRNQETVSPQPQVLPTSELTDEGTAFVDKATQITMDNISDAEFNIDLLCREMAMSRTLFYVKLKTYTGKSPQEFIRIIRMEHAADMLRHGRSVTDAATMSGFDNVKYFSTVFKKYFGISPSKFQ